MPSELGPPAQAVRDAVERALVEDLTPLGDLTSSLVADEATVTGAIVARAPGVVAGTACVVETFAQLDQRVVVRVVVADGGRVAAGAEVASVSGPLRSILTGERTALNFLGHLSGVATSTAAYVDEIRRVGGYTRLWDTRKTTPGLRALEKAAVRSGGAVNHRANLSDWILLKDNHLVDTTISAAVEAARDRWPGRTVHVECDRLDQFDEALAAGVDAVLLDNMSPAEVVIAVERRDAAAGRCLLEASGGITLETVASYAATGVDMISTGRITNSAPVLDVGLDIGEPG